MVKWITNKSNKISYLIVYKILPPLSKKKKLVKTYLPSKVDVSTTLICFKLKAKGITTFAENVEYL